MDLAERPVIVPDSSVSCATCCCIMSVVKGSLKSFLIQMRPYKRLPKSQWRQQNLFERFRDIREFLKIDFYPKHSYFSNKKTFSSFIEYTLLLFGYPKPKRCVGIFEYIILLMLILFLDMCQNS